MTPKKLILCIIVLCTVVSSASACSLVGLPVVTQVTTSPSPFGVVFTQNQCYVFVAVTTSSGSGAIDVLVNTGNTFQLSHTAIFKAGSAGRLIIDPTNTYVYLTGGQWVGKVSVLSLIAGNIAPLYWDDPVANPGIVNLIVRTSTQRLFVVEEGNASVVILEPTLTFILRFATDQFPVGLAWNDAQTVLYVTSQVANGSRGWPLTCPQGTTYVPQGTLSAVSVPSLVSSAAPAGCSPVRVLYNNQFLYVTVRGENLVKVFSTALLLQQNVATGNAPVGEAFKFGSTTYYIQTDSDRFTVPPVSSYARAYVLSGGFLYFAYYIAETKFPREVTGSPDGTAIAVTNAISNTVQLNKF